MNVKTDEFFVNMLEENGYSEGDILQMQKAIDNHDKLVEALAACVDLMRRLPTLDGFVGLAILESAADILEQLKELDK